MFAAALPSTACDLKYDVNKIGGIKKAGLSLSGEQGKGI